MHLKIPRCVHLPEEPGHFLDSRQFVKSALFYWTHREPITIRPFSPTNDTGLFVNSSMATTRRSLHHVTDFFVCRELWPTFDRIERKREKKSEKSRNFDQPPHSFNFLTYFDFHKYQLDRPVVNFIKVVGLNIMLSFFQANIQTNKQKQKQTKR